MLDKSPVLRRNGAGSPFCQIGPIVQRTMQYRDVDALYRGYARLMISGAALPFGRIWLETAQSHQGPDRRHLVPLWMKLVGIGQLMTGLAFCSAVEHPGMHHRSRALFAQLP